MTEPITNPEDFEDLNLEWRKFNLEPPMDGPDDLWLAAAIAHAESIMGTRIEDRAREYIAAIAHDGWYEAHS